MGAFSVVNVDRPAFDKTFASERRLHLRVVSVCVNSDVACESKAKFEAGFENAALCAVACDAVNRAVWFVVLPRAVLNLNICRVDADDERKHTADFTVCQYYKQLTFLNIIVKQGCLRITAAPLRRVAVTLHILARDGINAVYFRQILVVCVADFKCIGVNNFHISTKTDAPFIFLPIVSRRNNHNMDLPESIYAFMWADDMNCLTEEKIMSILNMFKTSSVIDGGQSMSPNEQDARQSIIDVTKAILEEVDDVEKITVRQVAERAGVGIGLINYHFKSKDNLLSIAIGDVMIKTIWSFTKTDDYPNLEPIAKLKAMMKELYALAGSSEKLIRFILTHEILEGNMQTPLYLVPLLREIFGNKKDEMQLRIIALQLLYPIQVTGINPDAFHLYSGIDLYNIEQRDRFIDTLVNNLINQN